MLESLGIDAYITAAVILGAVVLFVTEKLSVDLIALLLMGTLVVAGVITPAESMQGFSNPETMTVAFMFVISAAILKTGSLQYVAGQLTRTFQNHYQRGVVLLMLVVSSVSAFINNTPVVAVMIPVTIQIAKNANRAASKLLIPVSYASIFGGTCTLIGTSTNILVSGIAEQNGIAPFGMFDFAPMGLVFVVVGSLFMIFIGQRLSSNTAIIIASTCSLSLLCRLLRPSFLARGFRTGGLLLLMFTVKAEPSASESIEISQCCSLGIISII